MRLTVMTLLGLGACLTAAVADDCVQSPGLQNELSVASGYSLDANYFTDTDDLKPPSAGLNEDTDTDRLDPGKRKFCGRSEFDIMNAVTSDKQEKISFVNPDGFNSKFLNKIFGRGLCWWHTRFQRASAYLANYFPFKPRPSHDEALKIIDQIISEKSVVEIPGFADLEDFTKVYQDDIAKALNNWKLRDMAAGRVAARIFDSSSEQSGVLQGQMSALYDRMLNKPQLAFLRIHKQGETQFDSHALLLTKMEPIRGQATPDNPFAALNPIGYRLTIIDSNYPTQTSTIDYNFGQTSIKYCPTAKTCEQMIPREAYTDDLPKIDDSVKAYCTAPDQRTAKQ